MATTTDTETLDAALKAYGDVSFEAYEAGSDFDHELAIRATLAAVEPLIRERIAVAIEGSSQCRCKDGYCVSRNRAKHDAKIARTATA